MRMRYAALALLAAFALAACGHSAPAAAPAVTHSATPAAAAASTPAAEPDSPAGARAAAQRFFALYSAGQYAAAYPLLSEAARAAVTEAAWAAVHGECQSSTAGLSYDVGTPVMAGPVVAVMKVSLAGAASAIGSEEETFDYQGGQWVWAPAASDMAMYRGGNVAVIVSRMKAAGNCG